MQMFDLNCSYYDEDQEKLFNEAHVISPFRKMSEGMRQSRVQVILGVLFTLSSCSL